MLDTLVGARELEMNEKKKKVPALKELLSPGEDR